MADDKQYAPWTGDISITLGDKDYVLRPTLEAALALSRQAGGIRAAITRVLELDLDVIIAVIRAGIGREAGKELRNLDRVIYEHGLLDAQGQLVARCVEFLTNLARGGRPASADEDSGDPPQMQ